MPAAGDRWIQRCNQDKAGSGFHAVCLKAGNLSTYGLVHEQGVCSSCDRQRYSCQHVQTLKTAGWH